MPISSMKRQDQSSPGSIERMIAWPDSAAWARAWRLGKSSQQPTLPQPRQMRRCSQPSPLARQSSQPGTEFGQLGHLDLIEMRAFGHRGSSRRGRTTVPGAGGGPRPAGPPPATEKGRPMEAHRSYERFEQGRETVDGGGTPIRTRPATPPWRWR